MGMFSWYTQDTNKRIVAYQEKPITMTDMFGNKWVEECYEGYGVFGGKDFYELLDAFSSKGGDIKLKETVLKICNFSKVTISQSEKSGAILLLLLP